MQLRHALTTSYREITRKKSRSALTILGIVVGVMSIMLIQSTGKGAEKLILGQIEGFGSRTIAIEPGREPQGPSDFISLFMDSLTARDVEALLDKNNVPELSELMPNVYVPGTVSRAGETVNATTIGGSSLLSEIMGIEPEEGMYFSEEDIKSRASVALIGDAIRTELFGASDVIGKKIKIKGRPFQVIGVFGKTGKVAFFDIDHLIVVPYTTAQEYLLGIDYFHELFGQATSDAAVERTVEDIEQTLREMHRIENPSKDDFHVMTQKDTIERVQVIMGSLTILLSAVAAISLVVGGIGIMNILLVSVSERTREIGLRKAVGATNTNILIQFLFEALLLTSIGGAIGIALGAGLSYVLSLALTLFTPFGWKFTFPFSATVIGLLMAAGVGIVFGIYPAQQAAKKSPMEALRYE
jgi:putative ABC transport system permease protein